MKNNDDFSIPLKSDRLTQEKIYDTLYGLSPQQSEIILLLKENFSCSEMRYITDYKKNDLFSIITSTLTNFYEHLYSKKISNSEAINNFFKHNDYRTFLNNLSEVQSTDIKNILCLITEIQKIPLKPSLDSYKTIHATQVAPYKNNFLSKIFATKYVTYSKYLIAASLAFVALNFMLPGKKSDNIPPTPATPSIQIFLPEDQAKVDYRTYIKGKLTASETDKLTTIWVIIHPQNSLSYYVQPKGIVNKNGDWKIFAFIGAKNKNKGDLFQVMAVANPDSNLKESDILSYWPSAEIYSDIVEIERY